MLLIGMGQAQTTTDTAIPVPTSLPSYMYIDCDVVSEVNVPANDSLISTTAGMMDWCGCENKLNPDGLAYAGSEFPGYFCDASAALETPLEPLTGRL